MEQFEDFGTAMDRLDRFRKVYDTVNWDADPQDVFFHETCKITFSSKCLKQLAINRGGKK